MTLKNISRYRLMQQQLVGSSFVTPVEVVHWLVAMQAQEYAQAKWAIGLRGVGLTDARVEQAFNEGAILRTHVLRPTWHFVTPQDIRWLQDLSAARVQAFNAYYYRRFELDNPVFKKANKVLEQVLRGGNYLTRPQLSEALGKARIKAQGERMASILMNAELEKLICSGPRKGKQFTYALLDERAPATGKIPKDEALRKLTLQYFTSRGPATVQDFAWWSWLTVKDIRKGIGMLGKELVRLVVDEQEYFMAEGATLPPKTKEATFLMPDYDEYGIAYKDRRALAFPGSGPLMEQPGVSAWSHWIIVDGVIRGTWAQVVKKDVSVVELKLLTPLNKRQQEAVSKASRKYTDFVSN